LSGLSVLLGASRPVIRPLHVIVWFPTSRKPTICASAALTRERTGAGRLRLNRQPNAGGTQLTKLCTLTRQPRRNTGDRIYHHPFGNGRRSVRAGPCGRTERLINGV